MSCEKTFCTCGECWPHGPVTFSKDGRVTIPVARYNELLETEWMYKDLCS